MQCVDKDVKPPAHMYHIKKRGQTSQYVKYTQHEFIYRGDIKFSLHISNSYQLNFKNFDNTKNKFWNFLKSTK